MKSYQKLGSSYFEVDTPGGMSRACLVKTIRQW